MEFILTATLPLLYYSWSLLLLQQPVGREDIHHHVWSNQHVLLSCHGTFGLRH